MVYCDHCLKDVTAEMIHGYILCCRDCGKVLEECNLFEEPQYVKKAARKVDELYNEEDESYKKIKLWEYKNHEYIKKLSAKEKIAKKAFKVFLQNCSNDLHAPRDKLAQSAVESLAKPRKKVQSEPPSGNHNNLESKDKTKEDELGSVDHGSDDYDELDLDDEFTDSDMDGEYENILYQENGYNKAHDFEDDVWYYENANKIYDYRDDDYDHYNYDDYY